MQQQRIELDRMQNNQVLVVAKLSELVTIFPDRLIIIPSQPIPKKDTQEQVATWFLICDDLQSCVGENTSKQSSVLA